jgi:hypothetical protein
MPVRRTGIVDDAIRGELHWLNSQPDPDLFGQCRS